MNESIISVRKIVKDLYDEFQKEEIRLNEICNNHSVKIDELDQKIHNYKKNEDIDFKVFSPRNNSGIDSQKINDLEKEKESLQNETRNYNKQLKYYSEKVRKLDEALSLIDGTDFIHSNKGSFIDSLPEKAPEEVIIDPFDELFPARKADNNIEKIESETEVLENTIKENETEIDVEEIDSSLKSDNIDTIEPSEEKNEKYFDLESLNSIVHKAEFTERIISSDSIRAKLEIKEIIKLLKEFIHKYA